MRFQLVTSLAVALGLGASAALAQSTASSPDAPDAASSLDAGSAPDAGLPLAVKAPSPAATPPPPPRASEPPPGPPLDLSFLLPLTPALTTLHYDLSVSYTRTAPGFAEGPMTLTGLRFVERNSGLGKMLVYFATQLLMAAGEGVAASQGRYVGSSYGVGYRVDYYRPYSSQELANMRAARESAGDNLLNSTMGLDLQLFLPVQGLSTASGVSVEFTPVTVAFTDSGTVGLELAFLYQKHTDALAGDPTRLRSFEYVGTPLRLMANWQFLQLQLQWAPNFIGGFGVSPKVMEAKYAESISSGANLLYTNSPWSLSVTLTPLKHLFLRATGSWTRYEFSADALGFQLEGGLRL